MIDLEFLKSLIQAIDESSLDSIEIERGGTRIRLGKSPPAAPIVAGSAAVVPAVAVAVEAPVPVTGGGEPAPAEPDDAPPTSGVDVTSPMVGTFYRAPAPDAPSYVDVGSDVSEGTTLCIIEAMKLMNELESEVRGKIIEICVQDAEPVEYGQLLFRIDPA